MSPPGTSGGRPVACDYCKNKKIRCEHLIILGQAELIAHPVLGSGDSPCENCHSKGVGCRYPPVRHPKDRRRRSSPPESTRELDKRLAQLEELLKASHQSPGGRVPIFIGGQSPASGQTQQPSNYERDCDASLVDWMLDLEPTSFTPSKFAPDYSVQDGIASEEAHVNEEGRTYDMNPSYSHSLDYMQFNTASFVAQPSHSGAPPSRSRHTSGSPGSGNDTSPPMHLKGIRRNSIMSPTEVSHPRQWGWYRLTHIETNETYSKSAYRYSTHREIASWLMIFRARIITFYLLQSRNRIRCTDNRICWIRWKCSNTFNWEDWRKEQALFYAHRRTKRRRCVEILQW